MVVSVLKTYKNTISNVIKLCTDRMESVYVQGGRRRICRCYVQYYGIWQNFEFHIKNNYKLVAWEERDLVFIGLPYEYIELRGLMLNDNSLMGGVRSMIRNSIDYPRSYQKYCDMLTKDGFLLSWADEGIRYIDDLKKTEYYQNYVRDLNDVSSYVPKFKNTTWKRVKREDVLPLGFLDFDANLYYWFKSNWADNDRLTSFNSANIFRKGTANISDIGWRFVEKAQWNTTIYNFSGVNSDTFSGGSTDNSMYYS